MTRTTPPPAQDSPVRRSWPLVAAGSAAAVVLALVLVVILRDGDGDDAAAGGTGGAVEMEHIHGVGVDADGTLYAGSHYGLYRIDVDGTAVRVSEVQDFMGFTTAGPEGFLASGHPGESQDGPSSVGLIQSTDGGRAWSSLSLSGEADFHALEYRHDRVYALNSMTGALMVSDDLRSWETRFTGPIADIAVSPEDPDTVVATTEQGLGISRDGGATFASLGAGPIAQLASWAEDGTLVVATPDGTVYTSTGKLTTWTKRGSLQGPPEALTATTGEEIYAAANGDILTSRDGGATFSIAYDG